MRGTASDAGRSGGWANLPDMTWLHAVPGTLDPVVVAAGSLLEDFFADDGKRRQDLEGFDEIYADIVHYIIRCTHRIWEEGEIDLLHTHYADSFPLHTSEGTQHGRDLIIKSTIATQSAYPDIRLHGDDVVWSGDDVAGFHCSHRMTHTGTHLGRTAYGPPTGLTFVRRTVAHTVVRENMVIEEWLTRDELNLVRSLGFDEVALAREIGSLEAEARGGLVVPAVGVADGTPLRIQPEPIGTLRPGQVMEEHLVRSMFHDVWNERRVDLVESYFSPDAVVSTSTNRSLDSPADYRHFLLGWFSEFSDVTIDVEHVMSNARHGGRVVATRWRLHGTHDGPGPHGPPSGRKIQLIGFSHHLVRNGQIAAEWTVFDEFSLLKQIHATEPATSRTFERHATGGSQTR